VLTFRVDQLVGRLRIPSPSARNVHKLSKDTLLLFYIDGYWAALLRSGWRMKETLLVTLVVVSPGLASRCVEFLAGKNDFIITPLSLRAETRRMFSAGRYRCKLELAFLNFC
jgi:hypothetical protein